MATKPKTPLGRGKSLDEALARIAKDRDLSIGSLSEHNIDVEAISTGNIAIDHITGVSGLPKGRLVELFGPPSSGKTTCALQVAAHAQQQGDTVLYLDYEHAMDPEYCSTLGLDVNAPTFLFAQPETFEQGMNAMRELIETGEIAVVIVDSVASMVIEKELSIETGGSTFADKAKLMAQAMRQLTGVVQRYNVCVIFLNHIQQVIDTSPIGQKLASQGIKRSKTPGGDALKFHASVRMEFKPVGNIRGEQVNELTNEKEDIVEQTKVQVTCVKNKVGPPFRSCVVRVRFGKGFSQAQAVLDVLTAYKVVKKKTGTGGKATGAYELPAADSEDVVTLRGESNVVSAIEQDAHWLAVLTTLAHEQLDSGEVTKDAGTADELVDDAFEEDEGGAVGLLDAAFEGGGAV